MAYVTTDDSNFMLTGSQCDHPNFCRVDQQVVSTQSDANFEEVREVLTEHFGSVVCRHAFFLLSVVFDERCLCLEGG